METVSNTNIEQTGTWWVQRFALGGSRAGFPIFSILVAVVLFWAWLQRDYRYMQAESGFGYALGIIGASMMAVLLLYPLRKRLRFMRSWLKIKSWFRAHMLLGVLGPSCILLHSNFQLGSTNSSVALAAMLLVAGSGLVGRYFYGKFHYGLYGKQVELQELKTDLEKFHASIYVESLPERARLKMDDLYAGCRDIIKEQHEQVSLSRLIGQRRWLHREMKVLRKMRGVHGEGGQNQYSALVGVLDKLAGLRLFERLFGLWHVVHIPVFVLMIVTAIVHILVVHWF